MAWTRSLSSITFIRSSVMLENGANPELLDLRASRYAVDCLVDCLYAGGVIAFSAVAVPARRWRRTVIERFRANHLIALANFASFSASATFPSGLRGSGVIRAPVADLFCIGELRLAFAEVCPETPEASRLTRFPEP